MAVLQSIQNVKKRFLVFVANRLTKIQDGFSATQWRYVDTKSNVADEGSRGVTCPKFVRGSSRWLLGPEFLRKDKELARDASISTHSTGIFGGETKG